MDLEFLIIASRAQAIGCELEEVGNEYLLKSGIHRSYPNVVSKDLRLIEDRLSQMEKELREKEAVYLFQTYGIARKELHS